MLSAMGETDLNWFLRSRVSFSARYEVVECALAGEAQVGGLTGFCAL